VRKVVEHQRDFFELGPSGLKPLPMTQVASELGIHVATVSRAVAEKFIATPRGVQPLRKFFSGGLQTQEGESVAWEAVRSALKDLIDNESKASPLSDDALSEALKDRGMDIARRTVAKYREQMGVPTARLRRAF
jgi:RNA polymerase sigma-54 factor